MVLKKVILPFGLSKRAQMSMVQIYLAGFTLLAVFFVFYFSVSSLQDHYQLIQAEDVVDTLASTADKINALGPASKKPVYIDVPAGITGAVVKGHTLSVALQRKSGEIVDIFRETNPSLVGEFAINKGNHRVAVRAINDTLVRIGEGLFIFDITPDCIRKSDLPVTITLFGDDFNPTSILLKNGVPYPAGEVTYVNVHKITFNALNTQFPANPKAEPVFITVQSDGVTSNSLLLYVVPASVSCVPGVTLDFAHLYTKDGHTFIEDITSLVSKDDGNKKTVKVNEIVHLQFPDDLKKGDFIYTSHRCHEAGNITIMEEGSTIAVGLVGCRENDWHLARIPITEATSKNDKWDLHADVGIDYDFISG